MMEHVLYAIKLLQGLVGIVLFPLLVCALYALIQSFAGRRKRPRRQLVVHGRSKRTLLERWMLVPGGDHPQIRTVQGLLNACALQWSAGRYLTILRLNMIMAASVCALAFLMRRYAPQALSRSESMLMIGISILALAIGASHSRILEKLKTFRRYRVMRDIDAICRQLLYYSGFNANLHGKLMRCLPLVKAMRSEWFQLTGEWYHNAEYALRRFRERVATEEGTSFAETLNALRQYDDERYYSLLKERIADSKAKMELYQDARRESVSYVLFVMSGIPIIYTFRLFIYPWAAEGQQLFQLIG